MQKEPLTDSGQADTSAMAAYQEAAIRLFHEMFDTGIDVAIIPFDHEIRDYVKALLKTPPKPFTPKAKPKTARADEQGGAKLKQAKKEGR